MKKRALIITYYWPPAGGPGVQRWLNFVKHLPGFDIEPLVICPENPAYPILDTSFEAEVDPEIKVYKTKIKEPYNWAKLISKKTETLSKGLINERKKQSLLERMLLIIRGNFFIPDARFLWVKPTLAKALELINTFNIEVVITTGPPHSVHLIGQKIKKELAITWLADFRDPWTTIGYHKKLKLMPFAKKRHIKLEKEVLDNADKIIVTSEATKKEFKTKTHTAIVKITNGYVSMKMKSKIKKDKSFTVCHIGSLLTDRNPINLWEAIKELIEEDIRFKTLIRLEFMGLVSPQIQEELINRSLEEYVHFLGYQPHHKAIEKQRSSALLLLIEIDSKDTQAIIPGKLFEYMASQTPVLALGPKNSEVGTIINETQIGKYYLYTEKKEIKKYLHLQFEAFLKGNLEVKGTDIEKYSRKKLTSVLAEEIKR